ncbi:methyltransferase domain-containing protein [Sedimentitalea nanhaiensis]|uniref:Methyltransferase domain-containing protein n=1 Tax=Sedimentitalea nanhaiensis TaxID=999627 RepID=A0A1I7E144_9RHOB|nr:methyltransferase domain-containing protein [Sedimentitalea nanhaiensis]SFU17662.1 Methyltransferase domain-containing protein [Sedimentitalea nanhaiensis]
MLKFDAATAQILEEGYQGADVSRRRRASFDALSPCGGERILDLGCGNGLMTLELARAVGSRGHVTGVDPSPDMMAVARTRCEGRDNVTLLQGAAADLPLKSDQFDKAIVLQVMEYFDDRTPCLHELHRVLRPGGRLVIGDIHWDTLAWHSSDMDRMTRMIDVWDAHLAERRLPALLPSELRTCGFAVDHLHPESLCDITLRPDGLARMMMILIRNYAISSGGIPESEARAWFQEQQDLARSGQFFFAITHFVVTATAR